MLGRLRRWRDAIAKEAGLLGRFLSMNQAEVRAALNAPPPLPATWHESIKELRMVVT